MTLRDMLVGVDRTESVGYKQLDRCKEFERTKNTKETRQRLDTYQGGGQMTL